MDPSPFFDYARERYQILLRRRAGQRVGMGYYTADPILQTYRFCNIFREDDTTTLWMKSHVRETVAPKDLLLATVIFRWFNRITTGEAIFQQLRTNFEEGAREETAWESLIRTGELDAIRDSVLCWCGTGPYVTGSYIIKTPDGMSKLDGVIWCVEQFMARSAMIEENCPLDQGELSRHLVSTAGTDRQMCLEQLWHWLRQFPYMGDFMAYEVVTDMRHTSLMDRASDIDTWANPGPGAMRGLNRLHGRDLKFRQPKVKFLEEMQILLFISQDRELWPGDWPSWEMREVEHTLCEFDKYERVRLGQGEPRQKFRMTP